MIKVGLVGCGAIGTEIAKWVDKSADFILVAVSDKDEEKAVGLAIQLKNKPRITNKDKLISYADLVIEACHKSAVRELAEKTLKKRKSIMIMSVSGLLGNEYLFGIARKNRCRIYVPSGAICGIDGIKSASIAGIKSVTIMTTKHPSAFEGAPFVVKNKINLNKIKNKKLIFSGNALQAAKGFPQNINVCATLSLAGIGAKKTKVRIIADPKAKKNTHEIVIEGDFGKLATKTENIPSPQNPKTSYLAVLSAIAALKQISDSVKIGN